MFENILSFRTVFVFDVYLLNLQFIAFDVCSICVFYSGRLLIVGCHTYQSTGIQCAVTERLAFFNLPVSLQSSRRKYDEYVTSAFTRFALLLPRLSPFRLRQKYHCSMFEGRSIAKWHIWRGGWCLIHRTSQELISGSPCCPCSVQFTLLRPGSRNLSSLFGCQGQCAVRTPQFWVSKWPRQLN